MLTENDFTFNRLMKRAAKTIPDDKQLQLTMTYDDNIFKWLHDGVPHIIDHKIPQVTMLAPSLKQYWDMLMMTRETVQSEIMFEKANENFKTLNMKFERLSEMHPLWDNHKPIGFYISDGNNHHYTINVKNAKRLYCKTYQDIIMNDDARRAMFIWIYKFCTKRNTDFKIIASSRTLNEHTQKECFDNDDYDFRWDRCFIEMLIHYPNLENCIWNQKEV